MRLINSFIALSILMPLPSTVHAGFFSIDMSYDANVDAIYKPLFEQAADEWESYILGTQENYDVTLSITSSLYTGSSGGVLASAGPDYGYLYNNYLYATAGSMNFDSTDISSLYSSGLLYHVILHEMAHVIGFGTLWDTTIFSLSSPAQNVVAEFSDGTSTNTHYVGQYALDIYRKQYDNSALYVPLETTGGSGTAGAHWDEFWMGVTAVDELMTGYISATPFLSDVSIASFADIGYIVELQDGRILGQVSTPQTLFIMLSAMILAISRREKLLK